MKGPFINTGPSTDDAPRGPVALSQALLHEVRALYGPAPNIDRVRALSAAFRGLDLRELSTDDERKAAWINLYNALAHHALFENDFRGSILWKFGFYEHSAYMMQGELYSLNVIEHGILRLNRWLPVTLYRALWGQDMRLQMRPQTFDPRIHFALHCGAQSCPAIRSYDPATLDAQLKYATEHYFAEMCTVDRAAKKVTLPFLCQLYKGDFGSKAELQAFATAHLSESDRAWVHATQGISWKFGKYDWTIDRTSHAFRP